MARRWTEEEYGGFVLALKRQLREAADLEAQYHAILEALEEEDRLTFAHLPVEWRAHVTGYYLGLKDARLDKVPAGQLTQGKHSTSDNSFGGAPKELGRGRQAPLVILCSALCPGEVGSSATDRLWRGWPK